MGGDVQRRADVRLEIPEERLERFREGLRSLFQRTPDSLEQLTDLSLVVRLAAAVFAAALAVVKAISGSGYWLLARWFAGGILMLAIGEMFTAGLPLISPLWDSACRN